MPNLIYKDAFVEDVSVAKGIVTHYWSAFGNEDWHGDIIEKGAYAKSIAERGPKGSGRIKFLNMHNFDQPIGLPLALEEDSFGLLAVTRIAKETQLGRDILELYNLGILDEHSVGIDILQRNEEDRRRIKEARLWEGSVVTWGANPLTPVVSMKSGAPTGTIETPLDKQINKARRCLAAGNLSDEFCNRVELWLKDVQDNPHDEAPANVPGEIVPEEGRDVLNTLHMLSASLTLFNLNTTR